MTIIYYRRPDQGSNGGWERRIYCANGVCGTYCAGPGGAGNGANFVGTWLDFDGDGELDFIRAEVASGPGLTVYLAGLRFSPFPLLSIRAELITCHIDRKKTLNVGYL